MASLKIIAFPEQVRGPQSQWCLRVRASLKPRRSITYIKGLNIAKFELSHLASRSTLVNTHPKLSYSSSLGTRLEISDNKPPTGPWD